jgi:BCD family chlorophyll transporter-like MFS transporter
VGVVALALCVVALIGNEPGMRVSRSAKHEGPRIGFREAFAEVWAEEGARRFAFFIFVSMLAYSAQDLILEPFAGAVFGMTLGESTRLSSVQHGGVLAGMVLIAVVGSFAKCDLRALRAWIVGGCLVAFSLLLALASAPASGPDFPLRATFFALGMANGAFAAAAIAAMMQLVNAGRPGREGVRMGMFGAAQAIAFGLGGLLGTALLDLGRLATGSTTGGYAVVFLADAGLFLAAAVLALRIGQHASIPRDFGNAATAAS